MVEKYDVRISKFTALGIYAFAMGAFEAILVIYLRKIYYPEGFSFPLVRVSDLMFSLEIIREISTIVMIAAVAYISGRSCIRRFSFFLYIFALWDIFYYVFLKVLTGWPESLLTWDILFLIPIAWAGPVLAPLICSATMILMSAVIIGLDSGKSGARIGPVSWLLVVTGATLVFASFIQEYAGLIKGWGTGGGGEGEIWKAVTTYIPGSFDWVLFSAGEILILGGIFRIFYASIKRRSGSP